MAIRVARGFGVRAHTARLANLRALEAAGICELVEMTAVKLHGEGHIDYLIRIGDDELYLRTKETEPWIAGVAWGYRIATGEDLPGLSEMYRPDSPMMPGRTHAREERRKLRDERS